MERRPLLARGVRAHIAIWHLLATGLAFSGGSDVGAAERRGPEQGVTSFDGARINVDGEPFFPFGIYWFDAEDVATYVEHRMNVVYTQSRVSQLEAAASAGLMVIAAVPPDERIETFAAHPNLLAWFLMDDADRPEEVAVCRERRDTVRRYDRDHPVFASQNGRTPETDRPFREVVDIYCPYRYSLPDYSLSAHGAWLDTLREGFGTPTLWTTLQSSLIYSKYRALGFTDLELAQALEPAQLRLLVWTAIAHGVRGVLFWPERGFFDGREWTRDRRAEVGILGSEIDVLAPLLIEGTEIPEGARADRSDVEVCRVDRDDVSLLLAIKTGERYHLAVDEGVARDVEILVPGRAGARAWSVGFPAIRSLRTRDTGGDLRITLDAIDLTAHVVVAPDERALTRIRERMEHHLPDVARFATESATVFSGKVRHVVEQLGRLDVLPAGVTPPGEDPELEALASASLPDSDRYARARTLARRYRALGARCRDEADRYVDFAAPEAAIRRLTVHTLPQYFSSFDPAAATRALDADGDR